MLAATELSATLCFFCSWVLISSPGVCLLVLSHAAGAGYKMNKSNDLQENGKHCIW
jgi:hypothetical protein